MKEWTFKDVTGKQNMRRWTNLTGAQTFNWDARWVETKHNISVRQRQTASAWETNNQVTGWPWRLRLYCLIVSECSVLQQIPPVSRDPVGVCVHWIVGVLSARSSPAGSSPVALCLLQVFESVPPEIQSACCCNQILYVCRSRGWSS